MSQPTSPIPNNHAQTNPFRLLQILSMAVIIGIATIMSLTGWYLYSTVYRRVRIIADISPDQISIPLRSVRADLLTTARAYSPTTSTPTIGHDPFHASSAGASKSPVLPPAVTKSR